MPMGSIVLSPIVREPIGGLLRSQQNFRFYCALHCENVVVLRSDIGCKSLLATFQFLGEVGSFLGSISLLVLCLQSSTLNLDVSRLLVIIAYPGVLGFALTPREKLLFNCRCRSPFS